MIDFDKIGLMLSGRIYKSDIKSIVSWAIESQDNKECLLQLALSDVDRVSVNALWSISNLPKSEATWLQSMQNDLINRLLIERHSSKKRILFQILRQQTYKKDSIRTDFLDYCLTKINSECESYAIRSFSIYCAFKMCKFYPELIAELEEHLRMLSAQSLSPGLQCALKTTMKNIQSIRNRDI